MTVRVLFLLAGCAALTAACQDPSTATHEVQASVAQGGHADHAGHTDHAATATALQVHAAWARASVPGAVTAAGYLTITNTGATADTLLSATSPAAARIELHQTLIEDGIAKMRPATDLSIAPGATLKAEPGGLHLMLNELAAPLTEGQIVPLTLSFQHAGAIEASLQVRSATDAGPTADPHAHH